jgi:C-terminal processing protease CtpA/Prc
MLLRMTFCGPPPIPSLWNTLATLVGLEWRSTLRPSPLQADMRPARYVCSQHAGTQILRDISSAYVDSVNPDKLFETGMRAMLGSLDPYTEFENEESNRDLEITIMGGYGGVGLGVSEDWRITASGQERDPTRFRVANAMEGYAYDAGLRPGDHLTAVDGKELRGKKIEEVTQLLRGKPGSPVTVRFQRDGDAPSDERQAQLTRQVVRLKDVPLALLLEPKDDQVAPPPRTLVVPTRAPPPYRRVQEPGPD